MKGLYSCYASVNDLMLMAAILLSSRAGSIFSDAQWGGRVVSEVTEGLIRERDVCLGPESMIAVLRFFAIEGRLAGSSERGEDAWRQDTHAPCMDAIS